MNFSCLSLWCTIRWRLNPAKFLYFDPYVAYIIFCDKTDLLIFSKLCIVQIGLFLKIFSLFFITYGELPEFSQRILLYNAMDIPT